MDHRVTDSARRQPWCRQVIDVVKSARRAVLAGETDAERISGLCFDVAETIVKALQELPDLELDAQLVAGTFYCEHPDPAYFDDDQEVDVTDGADLDHWWVELDGEYVVDGTADQFNYQIEDDEFGAVTIGTYQELQRYRVVDYRDVTASVAQSVIAAGVELAANQYWHGTSGTAARKIAQDGFLKRAVVDDRYKGSRRSFTSMRGRSYMTKDLKTALQYAVTSVADETYDYEEDVMPPDPDVEFGLVLVEVQATRLLPDEDFIGQVLAYGAVRFLLDYDTEHFTPEMERAWDLMHDEYPYELRAVFDELRDRAEKARANDSAYNHDWDAFYSGKFQARIGKMALKALQASNDDEWRSVLLDTSQNVSASGRVRVVRVWVSDARNYTGNLDDTLELFFDYADELPVAKAKRVRAAIAQLPEPAEAAQDVGAMMMAEMVTESARRQPWFKVVYDAVLSARRAVLAGEKLEDETDTDAINGLCFDVAETIAAALKRARLKPIIVEGSFYCEEPNSAIFEGAEDDDPCWNGDLLHYWVELDGYIIDGTADQFNEQISGPDHYSAVTIGTYTELPRYTRWKRWRSPSWTRSEAEAASEFSDELPQLITNAQHRLRELCDRSGLQRLPFTIKIHKTRNDWLAQYRSGTAFRSGAIFWISDRFIEKCIDNDMWEDDWPTVMLDTVCHELYHAIVDLVNFERRRRGNIDRVHKLLAQEEAAAETFIRELQDGTFASTPLHAELLAALQPRGAVGSAEAAIDQLPEPAEAAGGYQHPSRERDARSLLRRFADSLNERYQQLGLNVDVAALPFLGHGLFGSTFALDATHVVKVTGDRSEASACANLIGQQLDHVVGIYDVVQLGKQHLYCIVEERLRPLPESTAVKMDDAQWLLWHLQNVDFDFYDAIDAAVEEADDDELSEAVVERQIAFLVKLGVPSMIEELESAGIHFTDYHSGNIMLRGRTPVITDLGSGSRSPKMAIERVAASVESGLTTLLQSLPDDELAAVHHLIYKWHVGGGAQFSDGQEPLQQLYDQHAEFAQQYRDCLNASAPATVYRSLRNKPALDIINEVVARSDDAARQHFASTASGPLTSRSFYPMELSVPVRRYSSWSGSVAGQAAFLQHRGGDFATVALTPPPGAIIHSLDGLLAVQAEMKRRGLRASKPFVSWLRQDEVVLELPGDAVTVSAVALSGPAAAAPVQPVV